MTAPFARPVRRLAVTFAVAGVAALGSVAIAPAASAAPASDGGSVIVEGPGNGNGPDAFIVTERGRTPVFFCDAENPKHVEKCVPGVADGGPRF
jgi:hypothetical protein